MPSNKRFSNSGQEINALTSKVLFYKCALNQTAGMEQAAGYLTLKGVPCLPDLTLAMTGSDLPAFGWQFSPLHPSPHRTGAATASGQRGKEFSFLAEDTPAKAEWLMSQIQELGYFLL